MRSLHPKRQSRTINMLLSFTEITVRSLGSFTHDTIFHRCTCKTGRPKNTSPLKTASSSIGASSGLFPPPSRPSLHLPPYSLVTTHPLRWIKYNHTCDHFSIVKPPAPAAQRDARHKPTTPQL